jgi:hypothetical protein
VRQKLRGAPAFYNNVPMQVTFRNDNYSSYSQNVILSGEFNTVNIMVPFSPSFAYLNENEKISEAVTAQNMSITTTGSKNLDNANFKLTVLNITDTVFVRAEQHWVAADDFKANQFMYVISPDRFWRVHMIGEENMYAKSSLNFNGGTGAAGYLDNGLMVAHGSVAFHEDSLKMFYRATPKDEWTEFPNITLSSGSKTDKVGVITLDSVKAGDYALGIKISSLNIPENKYDQQVIVYPNPSSGSVFVDLSKLPGDSFTIKLSTMNGKILLNKKFGQGRAEIEKGKIAAGTYIIEIFDMKGKKLATKKLVYTEN